MNILVLTANYPGENIPKEITPVVHYFAKEWVKQGCCVHVIHSVPYFPFFVYPFLKLFKKSLQNRYGGAFLTTKLANKDFYMDGVRVHRRLLFKLYPHIPYSNKSLYKHVNEIESTLSSESFIPDVITIHWDRPGLNLIKYLHKIYPVKKIFIAHGAPPAIPNNMESFQYISTVGFRSEPIRQCCLKRFDLSGKGQFMCYSGIPSNLIPEKITPISNRKRIYTFVGTLVKRKHPEALIYSLKDDKDDFLINYIGAGAMQNMLEKLAHKYKMNDKIAFCGRIPREEVCLKLKETKCFVMISSSETFGLVYIEAMANGCITIASKNEGMDGIINDGVNGFLCTAGDYQELNLILGKIEKMSSEELNRMSLSARETAYSLTDQNVADIYLEEIQKLNNK